MCCQTRFDHMLHERRVDRETVEKRRFQGEILSVFRTPRIESLTSSSSFQGACIPSRSWEGSRDACLTVSLLTSSQSVSEEVAWTWKSGTCIRNPRSLSLRRRGGFHRKCMYLTASFLKSYGMEVIGEESIGCRRVNEDPTAFMTLPLTSSLP